MSGYIGDGVPDSGRWNMAPDGNVQTGPSDSSMLVIFYKRPVHNEIKSAQAGFPIYEDQDYVKIQAPGESNLQVVDKPAGIDHKRRWPNQWQAYAAGRDQVADGTPLGLLFPRHPSAIAMLQGLGIMTVQHLANASATAIDAIGMHGQDYVNYAQKYLNAGAGGAAFHQMQLELEQQKRENARLAKLADDMQHQMRQINTAMLANAGVGVPMPGVQRQQAPAPAEPMIGGSMPRAPSFGDASTVPFMDAQAAQINATHPGAAQQVEETPQKARGWPKGKARGPRKTASDAA
jgi:hypothetical protein